MADVADGRARIGQPTLTAELADKIASLVRAGNFPWTAARALGIAERSWYRWMARGRAADVRRQEGVPVEEAERPYWQMWQSVERAEAESEVLAVDKLIKAMPNSPRAVIDWLERRFRQRWTRGERREVSGPDGGPVPGEDRRDSLRKRIDAIARRLLADVGEGDKDSPKDEETKT